MKEPIRNFGRRPHVPVVTSRRDLLFRAGMGFGGLALAAMLAQDEAGAASLPSSASGGSRTANPLAPKAPPLDAKADSVIFLFMEGGPSHVDIFDPKPE